MKIGFFDSGLGGLTVLESVRRALPQASLFYLGDSARTPYGSKAPETVIRYSRECANYLSQWNLDLLVVACNTASSHALQVLQAEMPFPVVGTIDSAVKSACAQSTSGRIGIIGTESTIASRVFEKSLLEKLPDAQLLARACPLFVPLVEQGMFTGEIVDKVIEHYLSPFKPANIDTLLLGCTHYPLLSQAIEKFFEGRVNLIECSTALAEELAQRFGAISSDSPAQEHYFVTDQESSFKVLASKFLGAKEIEVVRVHELPELRALPVSVNS